MPSGFRSVDKDLFCICSSVMSLLLCTIQGWGIPVLNLELTWLEFCSNASDALDKLRFLSVTDTSMLDANPNLEIRIKADHDAGILTIT